MKISEILIHYIAICISTIILVKIYNKYSENKIKYDKKIMLKIMAMSALCFFNNLFMFSIVRVIVSTILTFILFKWLFKNDYKSTIYYTLIITIALYIIDLICAIFLPLWIKNVEILNNSIFFKVGYSIGVNILLYIIMTNKYLINFFKELKNTSKNNKLFYIIGFTGLIICNIYSFYVAADTANKTLNLVLGFTELIILILTIILLRNKYEKNLSFIKEEQLKQNLKLYSKIASDHKELKHNLMNDLLIIKSKLAKKDQEFMNEIINKYKSNYDWVSDVTDIPEGLQGLVFLKKNQAELKKIKFNLEYNIDKKIEDIYQINNNFKLYETLGILFDNAIEGAYESKEKIINVVFSNDKKNLRISIFNTFNNDIDLERIGSKNYSTKNRGSGIGLNYIKNQRNKFKVSQRIQENVFITDIIINNKEKK